jgi:very-short-patch-repair endonuclease
MQMHNEWRDKDCNVTILLSSLGRYIIRFKNVLVTDNPSVNLCNCNAASETNAVLYYKWLQNPIKIN